MAATAGTPRTKGLSASKGLELFTTSTPNSHKIIIILVELKAAYPELKVTYHGIDILRGVQFEPWFTALNTNSKGPVLVDHDNDDFAIPESQAIALYLLGKYDPKHILGFENEKESITALRWSAWANSELGPAAVASIDFYRRNPGQGKAVKKFHDEVKRCAAILDAALRGRDYLVGSDRGKLSIADIFAFPFLYSTSIIGLGTDLSAWPNVVSWLERISERETVKDVFVTPWTWGWDMPSYKKRLADEEFAAQEEKLHVIMNEAISKI